MSDLEGRADGRQHGRVSSPAAVSTGTPSLLRKVRASAASRFPIQCEYIYIYIYVYIYIYIYIYINTYIYMCVCDKSMKCLSKPGLESHVYMYMYM